MVYEYKYVMGKPQTKKEKLWFGYHEAKGYAGEARERAAKYGKKATKAGRKISKSYEEARKPAGGGGIFGPSMFAPRPRKKKKRKVKRVVTYYEE